jgi:GT2 family glycosyltransferase
MTSKNHSRTHSLLVVLPVFGSVDLAVECLRSLRSDVTSGSDLVLVVNDQSPDSDHVDSVLRSELSTYPDTFRLVTNPVNRGLVETLNGAISSVEVDNFDVLLINSDVQITPGAVSEMRRILRADSTTGIVCPRSDNASLASIPHLAGLPRQDAIREFARWFPAQPESITAPVAVGFCMVIRGELFPQFGLFDPVFSPGYGEENDFSMRIRRGGWRVALANKALAFHVGGASFGRDRAAVLQLRNEIIFRRRYPSYTFDRELFLHNDIEGTHGSPQPFNPYLFAVALVKQVIFTVLGLAPQAAARLVIAIRRIDERLTR